jgi:CHAT domain-containing protein
MHDPSPSAPAFSRTRIAALLGGPIVFLVLRGLAPGVTGAAQIEAAQDLYRLLIDPLQPYLVQPRLIIIPHQTLHYLPFAALLDEAQQPLAARFTLSIAPSASSLDPSLRQTTTNEGHLLAFGNPETTATALPYAENEAKAIAALYPQANLLIGPAASEASLRQDLAGAYILHFATHGTLDPLNPLFSALLLAATPGTTPAEQDGRLEVQEVFNLDLHEANLVVLSACETALGEQSRGDELVGLSRAFLYAGSPVVVASLWPVEDEATSVLMTAFHRQIQAGVGPAAALTSAQAEVRRQEKWAAPYYWAGFVVIGDGGPEVAEQPTSIISTVASASTEATSKEAFPKWGLWSLVVAGAAGVAGLIMWHRRAKEV